ncbi:Citrate utilization protein B [Rhodovastum atsumiense]|uniref:Tricarballylate utilization 4Fe-4S protein TcuB n=1 Tax=Rhodovastum atsumiense TaxID=504468 RepID=A0A5M6IMH0_9PROT|nr:tricarballylate utilization 4Fe-4S protein TcuB [Rhodovastum atsumiense]KAA5609147.1 tricarballylate utilization 4Fe-4S protein TcuB [Rhodovastum atsumiense]CAH2601243.1 Citrate utilization protein B [Rhodovastum atsumiense]
MPATEILAEAGRLMRICNACRYCEGLCAVFPSLQMKRDFPDGELTYLANLCHGCGACYFDCQYAPPHAFNVNVPRTLAQLRAGSYASCAWPPAMRRLFPRNGLVAGLVTALAVAAFILGFAAVHDPAILFGRHAGPGAFYALMPHQAMVGLFGAAFLYAVVAIGMGVRNFRRSLGPAPPASPPSGWLWQAIRDAGRLRHLEGGGMGCMNREGHPAGQRLFHHITLAGFLLCFAATGAATLLHYLLGRAAPYAWHDLPVLLGVSGGILLLVGPAGLFVAKARRDRDIRDASSLGMDIGFTAMLFLTSLSGMALVVLRHTALLGPLLALHLGVVFALFVMLPYGKFVHGIYRFVALIRYAQERTPIRQNVPALSRPDRPPSVSPDASPTARR